MTQESLDTYEGLRGVFGLSRLSSGVSQELVIQKDVSMGCPLGVSCVCGTFNAVVRTMRNPHNRGVMAWASPELFNADSSLLVWFLKNLVGIRMCVLGSIIVYRVKK